MAPRRHALLSVAAAREALARRPGVRALRALAAERGVAVRIVGGAVRDAFLGRSGGDVDVAAHPEDAALLAGELARRLGTRVVVMGRSGTRVLRVPHRSGEVDVWETAGSFTADRDRRDFTVNALSFELPSWRFDAPAGALQDLRAERLRLPRPGVLLEDPLRVLRAARFSVALGFTVSREGLPELRRAAGMLACTAPERRLAEWDLLLAAPPREAARVLRDLERWGALAAELPGTSAAERRAGIAFVARLPRAAGAAVARLSLLAPLGAARALSALEAWKAPTRERKMAPKILALLHTPPDPVTRVELVRAARAAAPFVREAAALLRAATDVRAHRLGLALARLSAPALERILRPRRPLHAEEVAALLALSPGPALGRALARLDEAVAAGRVRSPSGARRFLLAQPHGR